MDDAAIKVVIVDDEVLERRLLHSCIDWEALNMVIVGEAQDANEALSLVEQWKPDVIFTDIQMPIIDGIRLSEMALKRLPTLRIVVLTGYDNFDYARRSIKAGISDYLLKPINDDEVFKTASKLKMLIERERRENAENEALRRQLYDNLPYLRERLINELLRGALDEQRALERMNFLGIRFRASGFQVAAIEIYPVLKAEGEGTGEESRLLAGVKTLNAVRAFFAAECDLLVVLDTVNRIVLLNNDENTDLYERCETLRERLAQESPCPFCIGLGSLRRAAGEICVSYREALDALSYRVAVGNNTVILYDSIRLEKREPPQRDTNELLTRLGFYLKTGLTEPMGALIDRLCGSGGAAEPANVKSIRITAMSIITVFLRSMIESGVTPDVVYKFQVRAFYRIYILDTRPDIRRYLLEVAEKTSKIIGSQQKSKFIGFIDEVKAYVDSHYAESGLSLTGVARAFFLNPSYLSRTFKKEAGVSFIEYLTTVRMEKAIALLKEKRLRAFEIADAVGIPDSNYFSTCFKKYTGESVSSFRKTLGSPIR